MRAETIALLFEAAKDCRDSWLYNDWTRKQSEEAFDKAMTAFVKEMREELGLSIPVLAPVPKKKKRKPHV